MEKVLKLRCIYLAVVMIVGVIALVLAFALPNLSEMQSGFASGFGISVLVAGGAMLIKSILALKNPEKLRKREIEETDERNVRIMEKSMAITFRICMLLQAITSIVLVAIDNEWGVYLGLIVGVELIVFAVSYVIICKKS